MRKVKIKKDNDFAKVRQFEDVENSTVIMCAYENKICSPDCASFIEKTRFAAMCQRNDLFIGKIVQ